MSEQKEVNFQLAISELLENEQLTRAIADTKTAKQVLYGSARKGLLNRVGLQWNPQVGLRIVLDAFVEREEEPKDGIAWALLLMSLGFNPVEIEGDMVWYEPRLTKQLELDLKEAQADAEPVNVVLPQLEEGEFYEDVRH